MLTVFKSGGQSEGGGSPGGAASYFTSYYVNGPEQLKSEWLGKGCDRTGISSVPVTKENVEKVFNGRHPVTNDKLVYNAESPGRAFAVDCVFSAPKSVSVAWATGNRTVQRDMTSAHNAAVDKAFNYMEKTYCRTRTGRGGKVKQPGTFIGLRSNHATSRAGDPQLHSHCLVSAVCRSNGKTGAVDMKQILNGKNFKDVGVVYQKALGAELKSMGYQVEKDTEQKFEAVRLTNVSREAETHFSTRSQEMKDHAKSRGIDNPTGKQKANDARFTRAKKPSDIDLKAEAARWKAEARERGFELPDLKKEAAETVHDRTQTVRPSTPNESQDRNDENVRPSTPNDLDRTDRATDDRDLDFDHDR